MINNNNNNSIINKIPMKWWTLYKDEIRSMEHVISFILLFVSLVGSLYVFFNSKFLQLVVLLITGTISNVSYYHAISFYVLAGALPFICLILFYDAIYRDLEDERVRIIVTKMRRIEYLFAKFLSRLTVITTVLIGIIFFISIYSYLELGDLYTAISIKMFIVFFLLSIFLGTIYLLISCFSEHPLFVSLLVPIISFIMMETGPRELSFFNYLGVGVLNVSIIGFMLSGALLTFMTTAFFFKRKRL
ncbi:MAG: hypothetical protein ACMXYG_03340 [Candidatus Woesearchaeota archaeon]